MIRLMSNTISDYEKHINEYYAIDNIYDKAKELEKIFMSLKNKDKHVSLREHKKGDLIKTKSCFTIDNMITGDKERQVITYDDKTDRTKALFISIHLYLKEIENNAKY